MPETLIGPDDIAAALPMPRYGRYDGLDDATGPGNRAALMVRTASPWDSGIGTHTAPIARGIPGGLSGRRR